MDITVTPAGDQPPDPAGAADAELDAASTSPLDVLRRVRDDKRAEMHLDLEVPRWRTGDNETGFAVRFRPMRTSEMIKAVERHEKTQKKVDDWLVNANADVLAKCCVSVIAIVDGERVNLDGGDPAVTPTTFNHSGLADALGVPTDPIRQVDVVKALYFTDGDLMNAANKLSEWSAQRTEELQEALSGE